MSDMPTLGRSRKRPPGPTVAVVAVLLVVALFVWWKVAHKKAAPPATPPTPVTAPIAAPPSGATPSAGNDDGGLTAAPQKPLRSAADDELEKAGYKRLRVEVNGPLETAVVAVVGPELGPRLVQVLVRSLVWWLAVPADLRRGDL